MKVLSCNSNRPLAEAIATYLDVSLTEADVRRFADNIRAKSCRMFAMFARKRLMLGKLTLLRNVWIQDEQL